jgi:hypothetical protein
VARRGDAVVRVTARRVGVGESTGAGVLARLAIGHGGLFLESLHNGVVYR